MISLGSNDARKGLGLGLGGRKMEEDDLEKGESCSYNNNKDDYDASTDPEADLSSLAYIDEKLQHVLGYLQKDFEGGVSAENLGAKFGGYGSFLPTYTRSPSWPHPKSPPSQSCNASISPKKTAYWASGSLSRKAGPPPINFGTLPALKASFAKDSIEQEVSITPAGADELASRRESANKKAANMPDQKILKVRIKVGPDNLSTQKNAAVYSGLGLGVSPYSSLDESPSGSEGMYRETQEALFESLTSILRFMTSFPLAGEALLSPLPDHLLNLIVKEKAPKENISDSGKGDGILLGDKKSKSEEKKDFPTERKSSNNRDMRNGNVAVSKKEVDVNILACEELVSKTLKLPLLSDSYSAVAKVKNKSIERNKGFHDVAEESVEPKLIQEIGWENPRAGSALDIEVVDPLNPNVIQRVTSHEQDTMKLPSAKEHASSGRKRKPKGSHSNASPDAEGAKESLRVGLSLVLNSKQTAHASNSTNKRESGGKKSDRSFQKAGDLYRDVFGDIGESEREENQTSSLEILPDDRPKIADKIGKNTSAIINGHSDILSVNKTEGVMVNESSPRATMGAHSISANVNIARPSLATAAPVLIKENWVCCDKCQKWRLLPININPAELPEKWLCSMLNWLPAMNRCSVEEEESTKAVFALYHVPAKNMQSSTRSGSLTDVTRSPVIVEPDLKPLIKCDFPVEKHKNNQKEKHKLSEHGSDGGDTKTSKIKGKRITDQDSLRPPKKIKGEKHLSGEDWMFDHAGKGGPSTSNDLPSTSVGKDQPKHSQNFSFKDSKLDKDRQQVSGKRLNDKVQVSLTDGSLDPMNCDGVEVSRKRKVDERVRNHLQGSRVLVKEEFSENDNRKEKKARVSKSGGKDSSASKSSGKLEKKGKHTQKHLSGQDLASTLSQQRLDGMDSLKRDSGSAQPSLAATSSSSKVSCSHKSKSGFHETKGSSVESVSSSPMRIPNPDRLQLTRNVAGKNEYYDNGLFVSDSPRCTDGEDNGGSDKLGTVRKENTSTAAQHGSLEPFLLDSQDKFGDQSGGSKAKAPIKPSPDTGKRQLMNDTDDYLGGQEAQFSGKSTTINEHHDEETQNENCSNANVSHSRKSCQGFSWPKDRSHNFKSGSVDVQQHHMPSYDIRPRDGRSQFLERPGVKSDEIENRFVENKESLGKLSGEIGKRENESNGQSDAKPVATGGHDAMSTVKQNPVQGRDGEEYTKRFHSENSDHAEIASERRKPLSLPPPGGIRNEKLTRHPDMVSGSQKQNGTDGSQAHDAFKVQKQIKKADHQSGSQQNSSRHTTAGGHMRDVSAPSPMRKDSLSQVANNALKEAKDLKHLADRVKSSGSNGESTALYFQAALKFLHSASLLESCNNENTKNGEMLQSVQIYSSTAKLCEFCAHEYERLKDMAAASLAYKCMEVAYMRVIYSCHANASRDRHELQAALQMVPPGESTASDVDNLNQPTLSDKAAFPKGVNSFQAAESHIISARSRPYFVRLLNFAQDVNYAMEASRKSRASLAAASSSLGGAKSGEAISSVKKALDFSFEDLEGVLRLVRVAMEAISH
ncbi:cysteine-tryptophan domain-containing zinc finger protein 3-like isoform X1 [Hibiscus syriacus]|uniref:cysteine-tryptophan domain-containing zinc finger protein 3-like isoform X1 n=1 Tax=Hibiscus syriacus TaxID=106335 RepID=UPI00192137DF|nr:cysteine-tryptophan domain-containing zinc finger protein 3-like isoform X1 [Hibiscus syriacus]